MELQTIELFRSKKEIVLSKLMRM